MVNKNEILGALTRGELMDLVDRFGVGVIDKRIRDTMVQGLAQAPRVELSKALQGLSIDRLRELCRFHGIDDSGRNKTVLLKRLTAVRDKPLPETQRIIPFKEFKASVLDAQTRAYLERLMESTQGNVTKAARVAQISRTHLQTLMTRYEIGRTRR